jgi:NAD(P)-dependent dehydrogenase (short-subunit alcohol dehydrogenase family)
MCAPPGNQEGVARRQTGLFVATLRHASLILRVILAAMALHKLQDLVFRKEFPVHDDDGHGAILITGTSSGIGRSTCGHMATKYPSITFYCGVRRPEDAKDHPFSLSNVKSITLDITKEHQIQDALGTIAASGLPMIGLVNNAGVLKHGTVENLSETEFRRIFEVNVFGTYRLTQAALPMLRASRGRIVMVGSMSGRIPGQPRHAAYQGSKYALEALTDSLRQEVASHGVSVSLLEPGMLASELLTWNSWEKYAVSKQETETYPDLLSEEAFLGMAAIYNIVGDMSETCDAIEHALMSMYPRTRYMTSRLGPLEASIFSALTSLVPDRANDWFGSQVELLLVITKLREFVERNLTAVFLGFATILIFMFKTARQQDS